MSKMSPAILVTLEWRHAEERVLSSRLLAFVFEYAVPAPAVVYRQWPCIKDHLRGEDFRCWRANRGWEES